ncbi:MAG: tetratricopeptide repeat protein [Cyanobacteria bacterium REEB67]|nr:tetratricopeptide repeat protein [Cyanobacteria bacterium REEB67]
MSVIERQPRLFRGGNAALFRSAVSVLSVLSASLWGRMAAASEFDDLGERSTAQLRILDRAIVLHPRDSKGFVDRAEFFGKANFEDKAFADFKRALELQPTDSDAYFKRGEFEMQLDDYRAALSDYLKAAQFAPDAAKGSPLRHAGRAQIKLRAFADGVKTLTSSLAYEVPTAKHLTLKERAICYVALHKYKEAIADVNAMGYGGPVHSDEALAIRAEAEFQLGQTQAAIDDLTLALRNVKKKPANLERLVFSSDTPTYYKLRARCYTKLGKDDLAAADLKHAKGAEKDSLEFAPFR